MNEEQLEPETGDEDERDLVAERIADELRALARSGHVTACSGLPLTQRVQTSGRAEPALAGAGELGLRALAKLGRLYAIGGPHRLSAVALWWSYSAEAPLAGEAHELDVALALLLTPEQRRVVVASWEHWGHGPSARVLRKRGRALLERAQRLYVACPEDAGSSGVFGELLAAVDVARTDARVLRREANALREAIVFATGALSWAELERVGRSCVPEASTPVRCAHWRSQRSWRCARGPLPLAPIDAQPACAVCFDGPASAPCRPPRRAHRRALDRK